MKPFTVVAYDDYEKTILDSEKCENESQVIKWLKKNGFSPRTEIFVKEGVFALVWYNDLVITKDFIKRYWRG